MPVIRPRLGAFRDASVAGMHAQSRRLLDAKSPPGVSLVSRIWHSAAREGIRELVTPRPCGATGEATESG